MFDEKKFVSDWIKKLTEWVDLGYKLKLINEKMKNYTALINFFTQQNQISEFNIFLQEKLNYLAINSQNRVTQKKKDSKSKKNWGDFQSSF